MSMNAEIELKQMNIEFGFPSRFYLSGHNMNSLIGKQVIINKIGLSCIECGKMIKKTYGLGNCYSCFKSSSIAVESIIRPELSQIHNGVALRDYEWEMKHHNVEHTLYLAVTSGLKVGIIGKTSNYRNRIASQGAIQAIRILKFPNRYLAGLALLSLKDHYSDKTNWRQMILENAVKINWEKEKNNCFSVLEKVEELAPYINSDYIINEDEIILDYPYNSSRIRNLKSFNLERETSTFIGTLTGIKAQYLIFNDQYVINIRRHSGLLVRISTF